MGHLFLVKNLLGRGEETVAWRSSRDASLPSTWEFGETATGVGRSIPGVRRQPRSRSLSSAAAAQTPADRRLRRRQNHWGEERERCRLRERGPPVGEEEGTGGSPSCSRAAPRNLPPSPSPRWPPARSSEFDSGFRPRR